MSETKPGRFCNACTLEAGKNGSSPLCWFRQSGEQLTAETKSGLGKSSSKTPGERFSRLAQIAKNTMGCPQISSVCAEIGPLANPRLGRNFYRITIFPSRPREPIVEYLSGKSGIDRNRL